jgi:hypothetical protein
MEPAPATRAEATADLFASIAEFDNRKRRQSTQGLHVAGSVPAIRDR